MGRVRHEMTQLLRPRGCDVNSNGVGGSIYVLRAKDDPVVLASLRLVSDDASVELDLDMTALEEFGIHQHAEAFRSAAAVTLRSPFR
eukprot:7738695-Pyramimonas_sp.AAC.1